MNLWAELLLHP